VFLCCVRHASFDYLTCDATRCVYRHVRRGSAEAFSARIAGQEIQNAHVRIHTHTHTHAHTHTHKPNIHKQTHAHIHKHLHVRSYPTPSSTSPPPPSSSRILSAPPRPPLALLVVLVLESSPLLLLTHAHLSTPHITLMCPTAHAIPRRCARKRSMIVILLIGALVHSRG